MALAFTRFTINLNISLRYVPIELVDAAALQLASFSNVSSDVQALAGGVASVTHAPKLRAFLLLLLGHTAVA